MKIDMQIKWDAMANEWASTVENELESGRSFCTGYGKTPADASADAIKKLFANKTIYATFEPTT